MAKVTKKTDAELFNAVIANIEKQMNNKDPEKFAIRRFGDIKKSSLGAISFGIPEVDAASNIGGVPRGKLIEIFGPESGGKSFLTLKLIASAQKQGLKCILIDAEQSFDSNWAGKQGVDTDNLYYFNESVSAEVILDYVIKITKSGEFGLVVIDSTAALIPQKELDGSITDQDYALLARAMSKACKQIAQNCGETGTTCAFINQIRETMSTFGFGDKTVTPGGKALKFASHQRISVFPGGYIRVKEGANQKEETDEKDKDKGRIIAKTSYVKFVKNKTAIPNGECKFNIVFDEDSLNPVVKLCGLARNSEVKAIGVYNGEFTINKQITDTAKNVPTGTRTFKDLAAYLIDNKLVVSVLDFVADTIAENQIKLIIDEDILEMKNDPSKIVRLKGTTDVKVSAELISAGSDSSEKDEDEEVPES